MYGGPLSPVGQRTLKSPLPAAGQFGRGGGPTDASKSHTLSKDLGRWRREGDVTVQTAAAAASVFAYVVSGFLIASLIAAKK